VEDAMSEAPPAPPVQSDGDEDEDEDENCCWTLYGVCSTLLPLIFVVQGCIFVFHARNLIPAFIRSSSNATGVVIESLDDPTWTLVGSTMVLVGVVLLGYAPAESLVNMVLSVCECVYSNDDDAAKPISQNDPDDHHSQDFIDSLVYYMAVARQPLVHVIAGIEIIAVWVYFMQERLLPVPRPPSPVSTPSLWLPLTLGLSVLCRTT